MTRSDMESSVPSIRIRACNRAPVHADNAFVLYWMIAARRTSYNFGLDRAVDWACELGRPLVILEALRCDYRWASERFHCFVLDGMAAQQAAVARTPAFYYPYVEPAPGAGKGLLEALARRACVVVTDDFPCFFLPRMVAEAGRQVQVKMEQVDSNGLYPLAATDRVFTTAASFRRHLHKELPSYLGDMPGAEPLARLPRRKARGHAASLAGSLESNLAAILDRWPAASPELLRGDAAALARLPIDHTVRPGPARGGAAHAHERLHDFLDQGLPYYLEERDEPEQHATSGLSPYLHFGHISAHEVFRRIMEHDGWAPDRLALKATGSRTGWWGASPGAEAFLDQLVTWRELGYNMAAKQPGYDRYESLPAWARATLEAHQSDERPRVYTRAALEAGKTYDPLWNAAQQQLVREGHIHNYLRMLWGKKVLEWTRSPRTALDVLIELNNRYALDGRNPNSYSGIFWCFGRYDRAWGPERPIFGKVRYMSSDSTARKHRVAGYIRTYGQ